MTSIFVYAIGFCLSFVFVPLATKSSRIFFLKRKEMNCPFSLPCRLPHPRLSGFKQDFCTCWSFSLEDSATVACWLPLLGQVWPGCCSLREAISDHTQRMLVLPPCTWHCLLFAVFSYFLPGCSMHYNVKSLHLFLCLKISGFLKLLKLWRRNVLPWFMPSHTYTTGTSLMK